MLHNENNPHIYLAKNHTFRKEFAQNVLNCTKCSGLSGYYEDSDGRLCRIKMVNKVIKQSPTEYKKGLVYFYNEEYNKLQEFGGYYLIVVFDETSVYEVIIVEPNNITVNSLQQTRVWDSLYNLN
ncbi:MAG: hypothetical protein WC102_01695 [Saccharofermentanales bacterium]